MLGPGAWLCHNSLWASVSLGVHHLLCTGSIRNCLEEDSAPLYLLTDRWRCSFTAFRSFDLPKQDQRSLSKCVYCISLRLSNTSVNSPTSRAVYRQQTHEIPHIKACRLHLAQTLRQHWGTLYLEQGLWHKSACIKGCGGAPKVYC